MVKLIALCKAFRSRNHGSMDDPWPLGDHSDLVVKPAFSKSICWWNQQPLLTSHQAYPISLFELIWPGCDLWSPSDLCPSKAVCPSYTHMQWHPSRSSPQSLHGSTCTSLRAPYSLVYPRCPLHSQGSILVRCRGQWSSSTLTHQTLGSLVWCPCARCNFYVKILMISAYRP